MSSTRRTFHAYGSDIYPGFQPDVDAACVAIREAGGIVLGKTVTTEFAAVNPNKTRNPHSLPIHRVAHQAVPRRRSLTSWCHDFRYPDGGSVIRPASFCSVVGYKPTIGQFSYAGVKLRAR